MAAAFKEHVLNFNIDKYLNPVVPPNQPKHLPKPISRWLGYRPSKQQEPFPLISQLFAFVGSFAGLLVVGAIYKYSPGINKFNPPTIIASLGASAILEYNAITSPLSQPRNAILGHGICAIIGVAISKAFQGYSDFDNLKWVAGALACALASLATGLTNTVHPPGGASAVLACIDVTVIAMGWWFVPVLLVGICCMLGVALINNNIARQYPTYWWSPQDTGSVYMKRKLEDEEKARSEKKADENDDDDDHHDHDDSASDTTLGHVKSNESHSGIWLSKDRVILPPHIRLSLEEQNMLSSLQSKLRGTPAI